MDEGTDRTNEQNEPRSCNYGLGEVKKEASPSLVPIFTSGFWKTTNSNAPLRKTIRTVDDFYLFQLLHFIKKLSRGSYLVWRTRFFKI